MTKRLKLFLITFVLSLPLWWGINVLAGNLEGFFFCQEIAKTPQLFLAEAANICFGEPLVKDNYGEEFGDFEDIKLIADNLELDTKAAILIEVDKNGKEKVIFERNSQKILPIASLSKLMTALVVFDLDETYKFSQLIAISRKAIIQEGTSEYGELKEGEKFSVETLLNIMLIESSNDAAYGVTELISQEAFVDLMNLQAEKIGLKDTHFVNSTGLDLDGQPIGNVSSARDLIKLSKYILKKHPEIFEITNNSSYRVLNSDGSLHHFIQKNTNELLGEFPEIIGGKTGWLPRVGGCLLLVLKNPSSSQNLEGVSNNEDLSEDSYFISVVLGAQNRFEEMKKLIEIAFD